MAQDSDSEHSDLSSLEYEPVLHMNMRKAAQKGKQNGMGSSFTPLLGSEFTLRPSSSPSVPQSGLPMGLPGMGLPQRGSHRGLRNGQQKRKQRSSNVANVYYGKDTRGRSASPDKGSHRHDLGGSVPKVVTEQNQHTNRDTGPLPIPINSRDQAALKMGRRLMIDISAEYDPSNANSSTNVARYFVDQWLNTFHADAGAEKVTPFGLEMLSRVENANRKGADMHAAKHNPSSPVPPGAKHGSQPAKMSIATACQVLDAMADELGGTLPVRSAQEESTHANTRAHTRTQCLNGLGSHRIHAHAHTRTQCLNGLIHTVFMLTHTHAHNVLMALFTPFSCTLSLPLAHTLTLRSSWSSARRCTLRSSWT